MDKRELIEVRTECNTYSPGEIQKHRGDETGFFQQKSLPTFFAHPSLSSFTAFSVGILSLLEHIKHIALHIFFRPIIFKR